MKKVILLLFIVFSCYHGTAQVAVSYFPFQSTLTVSSDINNTIWADLRAETNTFFANINLEPHLMYNFKRKDRVNYYLGAGVNFNPLNGYQDLAIINGYDVVIGSRVKPLKDYPQAFLIFEISPYINSQFNSGALRTLLGLGYNF